MRYTQPLIGLIVSALFLTAIGLLFVYSSSVVYALTHARPSDFYIRRQLIGALLGAAVAVFVALLPLRAVRKSAPLIFWFFVGLTVLTLTPLGVYVRGSRRWISLCGIIFQPSEFLKVAFVVYVASIIDRVGERRAIFTDGTLKILLISGMSSALLLMQPDFGQAVTILITALAMMFVAGFPLRHFVYSALPLLVSVLGLIAAKPYRVARIMTYLNPWNDPQGSGFQIIQSLIAIGSGGIFGVGIGQSIQKQLYLPMQHTDFIFSIIAEEAGLFGSVCIIFLYLLFFWSGVRCALSSRTRYGSVLIFGLVFLVLIQAGINIGVVTGLLPTKGIGLPFLSYGSSSLVATLFLCGLIACAALDASEENESSY